MAQYFMVKVLQTDEEVATVAFVARPGFEVLVDEDPTALVEMANAEVGAVGILGNLGQAVAKLVVEDAGHRGYRFSVGRRRHCSWHIFSDGILEVERREL